jgi:hypothetical protein
MLGHTEVNIGTFTEILVSQHSWVDKREDHWITLEYDYSAYRDFLTQFFWTGSRIVKTETRFSKLEDGMGNPEIALQYVYDIQFIDKEGDEQ